jgi:hypothetical protein
MGVRARGPVRKAVSVARRVRLCFVPWQALPACLPETRFSSCRGMSKGAAPWGAARFESQSVPIKSNCRGTPSDLRSILPPLTSLTVWALSRVSRRPYVLDSDSFFRASYKQATLRMEVSQLVQVIRGPWQRQPSKLRRLVESKFAPASCSQRGALGAAAGRQPEQECARGSLARCACGEAGGGAGERPPAALVWPVGD